MDFIICVNNKVENIIVADEEFISKYFSAEDGYMTKPLSAFPLVKIGDIWNPDSETFLPGDE